MTRAQQRVLRATAICTLAVGAACSAEPRAESNPASTGGGPASTCPDGQEWCHSTCTVVTTNRDHCGACDAACPAEMVCAEGHCASACPEGTANCDSGCVTLATDPLHCGACANACAAGQTCTAGHCECADGQLLCDGQCVDVTMDPRHCGACAVACGNEQSCTNGTCSCPAGEEWCAGTCTATSTDARHCGSCGTACAASERCVAGACVGGSGGTGGTGGTTTGGVPTGGTASGGADGGAGNPPVGGGSTGGAASGGTPPTGGADTGGAPGGNGTDYLCDVGVWDGSSPEVLDTGGQFAHDPTIVEADGTFHLFWTGNNVPHATSPDLRRWSNAAAVYGSYPPWVSEWLGTYPGNTFNFPWAPDASYFNDQYHLYSSFSAFFGQNRSCITHLTASDPGGSWTDHGPVICTDGTERHNAIDADAGLDFAGNAYLAFGSFWDGILAFPLNADGSRDGTELTRLAWASQIEAPVLFRRCGFYYLFVTWGLCCPGEGRSVNDLTYRVAVGRSEDILGPYVDRDGVPMIDGGGTLLVEGDGVEWAAAGHSDVVVSGDRIFHLYHAYRQSNGAATLRIVELPFDDAGWPVPGGP